MTRLRCRKAATRPSCLECPDGLVTTVGHVLGISGGDPSFRQDDGSAHPDVVAALTDFAAGQGSEHAVMTALAGSRLLVPVVAVLADPPFAAAPAVPQQLIAPAVDLPGGAGPEPPLRPADRSEKATDMAVPTLIGLDGRRAVPAFTSLDSLKSWQAQARPVPAAARAVWQAACSDSAAVVVDVAGPVPFAIEGARLAALARGEPPLLPFTDPDVHEIVTDVLANQLDIASFELEPADELRDVAIVLTLTAQAETRVGSGQLDVGQLGAHVADAVMARLGARFKRGVTIWLAPSAPSASAIG